MNKKFIIINIFLTFIIGFFVHYIYSWIPNVVTSIFPVNESLYEHIKLIYLSSIISSTILYFIFKKKDYIINNYLFGIIVSTIFNIIIFYLVYLPLYNAYGSIMIMTLIIYFITICLSNYLYYLIIEMNNSHKLNIISFFMIFIILFILTYLTYNPPKIPFFYDTINKYYGIK